MSLSVCANANYDAWDYKRALVVEEQAGVAVENFPVSFELDTERLLEKYISWPNLRDVRITVGGVETPCQLEKIDDLKTLVTFQISLGANQKREDVVLYYGNGVAEQPEYDKTWGKIEDTMDGFENQLLRFGYGMKIGTFGDIWSCQTEFTIKKYRENLFGGKKVPQSWAKARDDVIYWDHNQPPKFEIEVDGPVYKRVRFFVPEKKYEHHPGHGVKTLINASKRVTFYSNCPFVKEEFENIEAFTIAACPGGMEPRTDGRRNFDYAAYNFDSNEITWEEKESRAGWTRNLKKHQKEPRYRWGPDYEYNGSLILGVFNIHNGRGLGSVFDKYGTLFFVDYPQHRVGYSVYSNRQYPQTHWWYYVEEGREQIIERGKMLANRPTVTMGGEQINSLLEPAGDWGKVKVGKDCYGRWEVFLENSQLKVRYGTKRKIQAYITNFLIKSTHRNLAGVCLDGSAHRDEIVYADVLKDAPDEKTVRIIWRNHPDTQLDPYAIARSEISIYPDGKFIKIKYIDFVFAHIAEHGSGQWGTYKIYGYDNPNPPLYEDCFFWQDDRYGCYDVNDGVGDDARALNYNGHFIMGVYDKDDGIGYGRVIPIENIHTIKLLFSTGFELFLRDPPFESYIFAVTEGPDEVISLGKSLADTATAKSAKKSPPISAKKEGTIRAATCQFAVSEDIKRNAAQMREQILQAKAQGADVVHFPECALSGYAGNDFKSWDDFDWDLLVSESQAICRLAAEEKIWVIFGSAHRLSDDNLPHNCLYVIDDRGRIVDRYDKRFCTSRDLEYYSPGDHFVTFEINGVSCGVLICYDVRFPELYRQYKMLGVECMFHSFYNARGKGPNILTTIMPPTVQTRAAANYIWVSATNSSGYYQAWPSRLVQPDGIIVDSLPRNCAAVMVNDVNTREKFYDAAGVNRKRAIEGILHSGDVIKDQRSADRKRF